MRTIDDFGKKIGGARKDLWQGRGLSLNDLAEMTQNERVKFVVKDEVWKRPDYQAMKDSGIPVLVVFFVKTVRDACPTRPAYSKSRYAPDTPGEIEQRQTEYINFVTMVRDAVMGCTTVDQMSAVDGIFEREGYSVRHGRYFQETKKAPGLLTTKLESAVARGNREHRDYLAMEMRVKQFLYTPEEKMLAPYKFIRLDPAKIKVDEAKKSIAVGDGLGTSYYYYDRNGCISSESLKKGFPDGYIACRLHDITAGPFASEQEARTFILAAERAEAAEDMPKAKKKRLSPPVLGTLVREGPEDYRGCWHATGEMFLDTFGFYGGEFGNWLNDRERQANLNYGFDAFMDLARTLGIDEKSIAMNGHLSIAFGARGKGNALAHYEPDRDVINLTKMRGAGSLGHEWMHALDHYIGNGEYASSLHSGPMKKLMMALLYKDGVTIKGHTKFYNDAAEIDKSYSKAGHGYWKSNVELFARAGAAYLKDKGLEKGIRNDYLTGHADTPPAVVKSGLAYTSPQGEERKAMNKAFDEFFETLKAQDRLREKRTQTQVEAG